MITVKRQINELKDHVEEASQKKKKKKERKKQSKMPKDENHEGKKSALKTQEICYGNKWG